MSQPVPDAAKEALPPLRLLLIDDNPHDRDLVTRALSQHFGPVTVLPARDSQEFERTMIEGEFDAAIIDYELRWTTGIEALRRIKRSRPECPVLMFTSPLRPNVVITFPVRASTSRSPFLLLRISLRSEPSLLCQ